MPEAADEYETGAYRAALTLSYAITPALPLGRLLNQLDRYALHGTFYVYPPTALEWAKLLRTAAIAGHELGNGALIGVADRNGLVQIDPPELLDAEFEETERFLNEVLRTMGPRSFCYPLPSPADVRAADALARMTQRCNAEVVAPVAAQRFRLGQGAAPGRNDLGDLSPLELRTVLVPESEPEAALTLVEEAIALPAWTILAIQCGRKQMRAALVEAHEVLCARLAQLRSTVVVGSVIEVGTGFLDGKLRLGG